MAYHNVPLFHVFVCCCFPAGTAVFLGFFFLTFSICVTPCSLGLHSSPLPVKEPLFLQKISFRCSFIVPPSLYHMVAFLFSISSLPVSLTFSGSFASLCLPISTTSASCSHTPGEMIPNNKPFGEGHCRFHWKRASFICAQNWEQFSSVFEVAGVILSKAGRTKKEGKRKYKHYRLFVQSGKKTLK